MGEGGPDAAAPSEPVRVRLLTPEQLAKILEAHRYWELAFYAGDLLEQLGFPPDTTKASASSWLDLESKTESDRSFGLGAEVSAEVLGQEEEDDPH